jgi:hypothetical protein
MIAHPKHIHRNNLQLQHIPGSLSICPCTPSVHGRHAEGRRLMFTPAVAVMQDRYIIDGSQLDLTRTRWFSHLSFFASCL